MEKDKELTERLKAFTSQINEQYKYNLDRVKETDKDIPLFGVLTFSYSEFVCKNFNLTSERFLFTDSLGTYQFKLFFTKQKDWFYFHCLFENPSTGFMTVESDNNLLAQVKKQYKEFNNLNQ